MTIQTLKKKIEAAGYETKETNIINKEGIIKKGFFVIHDYEGLYPDENALQGHQYAFTLARKAGFFAEARGNKTATLIY